MGTFTLTKTAKGKKYLYTVTDETGAIISTRTSARDYVACTADGDYYFGRIDLIGKGEHGSNLAWAYEIKNNPQQAYKKAAAYWTPSFRKEWLEKNTFESWHADVLKRALIVIERNEKIAYLK